VPVYSAPTKNPSNVSLPVVVETVTSCHALEAPVGTVAVTLVGVQAPMVAATPPTLTLPTVVPKPVPAMVMVSPRAAVVGMTAVASRTVGGVGPLHATSTTTSVVVVRVTMGAWLRLIRTSSCAFAQMIGRRPVPSQEDTGRH